MTASLNEEPEINLEVLESRLETLRADLAEDAQKVHGLREQAKEARTRGDGDQVVSDLLRQKREAEDRLENTRETIQEVEELVKAAREATTTTAAKSRMVGVVRAYTSLLDQREKDIGRVEEKGKEFVEAVERLSGRDADLARLLVEAMVLAERFGLDVPDLARPVRSSSDGRVLATLKRVRQASPADPIPLPQRLLELPYRGGALCLQRVMERIHGTATMDVLTKVGTGILGNPEAWERKRQEDHDRRRDEKDAAVRAEAAKYDDWLRTVLAGEPVVVDLIESRAEAEEMRWRPDRNHPGASVSEAAARLGAFAVVPQDTRESSGAWRWTLGPVDGFVAVTSTSAFAGMR